MIYYKILLCLAVSIYLIAQAHALPPMLVSSNDLDSTGDDVGDPLDPSFVGETMEMPIDLNTIQQAEAAGIIKDYNSLYFDSSSHYATDLSSAPSDYNGSSGDGSGAVDIHGGAAQGVNVTGPWSLDLIALDQIMKHINLALVQNRDAIIGYGTLNADNETHKIIVSGSLENGRLKLAVTPTDSQDLYKLDLSLDVHTTGTYTAYSTSGATWSGDVAGSAPLGILVPSPESADTQEDKGSIGSQASAVEYAVTNAPADESEPIKLGKGKLP